MKYGKFGTMARLNPPGRAEKSISFLCCDHSASDCRIDSYKNFDEPIFEIFIGYANLEILWHIIKLLPRQWNTLDIRMFLPFELDDRFVKNDTFILVRKHSHKAFHKILGFPKVM
jgi:hypothetical protein